MDAIEIAQRYVPVVRRVYPHADVYLFGSYAKGYATERSDIDIAVVVGRQTPDPMQRARELTVLVDDAFDVDARIEPTVVSPNDESGFYGNILSTGIKIA